MWYKNIQLLFYPILQERAVCGVQLVAGTHCHCDGVIVVATCLHLSLLSPPYCSNLLQSLLHVLTLANTLLALDIIHYHLYLPILIT